jgi:hypothetical protein
VNDIDKLIQLTEKDDQRDRSAARFFKGFLIMSLCIGGLFVLLVAAFAMFNHN